LTQEAVQDEVVASFAPCADAISMEASVSPTITIDFNIDVLLRERQLGALSLGTPGKAKDLPVGINRRPPLGFDPRDGDSGSSRIAG
jgi:hypothetical protein